jgi:putative ABC transport system permease protein
MFKLAYRSARSHIGRLVLTALSIALAVSFLVGASITSATFSKTFAGLIADTYGGVDLVVRPEQGFSSNGFQDDEAPLAESVADTVAEVDGVIDVQPWVFGSVDVSTTEGKLFTSNGSLESWRTVTELRPYTIVEGTEPSGPNTVVIDEGAADADKVAVGDSIHLTMPDGRQEVALVVGLVNFGDAASLPQATTVIGDATWVRELLGKSDTYDRVWMTVADGKVESVKAQLTSELGDSVQVITGQKLKDDANSDFNSGVKVLQSVLTGFAVIALLVGSFLIANTFSMLVTQRSREIALLRALGAKLRQVRRSVLIEAALIGLISSIVGIAIGIGIGKLLIGLLTSSGLNIKMANLVVSPTTATLALVVGVLVTVAAAWLPIRRTTKTPPIAALRNDAIQTVVVIPWRRVIVGAAIATIGLVLTLIGSSGDPKFALAAAGGALLIFAVILLSSVLARPAFAVLNRVLPGRVETRQLSYENSRRNPRRSAATANALLIGLTLVTAFTVISASVKESLGTGASRQFAGADAYVQGPVPQATIDRIAEQPGVDGIGGGVSGPAKINGAITTVSGLDTDLDSIVNIELRSGLRLNDLGPGEVFVYKNQAKDGVKVGDKVDVEFAKTGVQTLTVAGVFENNTFVSDYLIANETFRENFETTDYDFAALSATDEKTAIAAAESATVGTSMKVQTIEEVSDGIQSQVNTLLSVVIGLLGVSLVIALMGIVNTMALSVLERTTEIGLLRAVGTKRRQIREMIRREAIMITLYGVVLGLILGTAVGWSIARTMSTLGIDRVAFDPKRLALYAIVGIVAGIIAAALPARRAAKLDVLEALHHT